MKQILRTCIFVGSLTASIAMAETPAQTISQASPKMRAMGICLPVPYLMENTEPGVGNGASHPNIWAKDYFMIYENKEMQMPDAKDVRVVIQPKHGTVSLYKRPWDELMSWRYVPKVGYLGQDRVEYEVDVDGQAVRLVYFIHVTKKNLDTGPSPVFCKKNEWKISLISEYEKYRYRAVYVPNA